MRQPGLSTGSEDTPERLSPIVGQGHDARAPVQPSEQRAQIPLAHPQLAEDASQGAVRKPTLALLLREASPLDCLDQLLTGPGHMGVLRVDVLALTWQGDRADEDPGTIPLHQFAGDGGPPGVRRGAGRLYAPAREHG